MTTEVLLVEERAIFCVEISRVLAVEWGSDVRNSDLLRRRIGEVEADFGHFSRRFQLVDGTGHVESLSIRVIGATNEPTDIPLALGSGVKA